jgi:hypothetical protein
MSVSARLKKRNMKSFEAIEKLRGTGAELLKREDRFGETRTGWWLDGGSRSQGGVGEIRRR